MGCRLIESILNCIQNDDIKVLNKKEVKWKTCAKKVHIMFHWNLIVNLILLKTVLYNCSSNDLIFMIMQMSEWMLIKHDSECICITDFHSDIDNRLCLLKITYGQFSLPCSVQVTNLQLAKLFYFVIIHEGSHPETFSHWCKSQIIYFILMT